MNIEQIKNTLREFQAENKRKFKNTQAEFKKAVSCIRKGYVSFFRQCSFKSKLLSVVLKWFSFILLSKVFLLKLWFDRLPCLCVREASTVVMTTTTTRTTATTTIATTTTTIATKKLKCWTRTSTTALMTNNEDWDDNNFEIPLLNDLAYL